ncbi:MAG TPA: PEP-CTERM sorting domain-containing protein [Caldimonas sp.]|jgi:hypothetical protein|nr:PEP-CTERM sorting domain-containing protein [Caldimonas sp.]HEX2539536.1 PEP-CTERM sorting domain-containing protein [Caldimonas sp.]
MRALRIRRLRANVELRCRTPERGDGHSESGATETFQAVVRLLAVAALLGPCALRVAAHNVLANPGFESGSFSGYSVAGNATRWGVGTVDTVVAGTGPVFGRSDVVVRSGRFGVYALVCQSRSVFEGCEEGPEVLTLTQTVVVTPRADYELGLWLGARSETDFGVSVKDGFFQLYVDGIGLLEPSAFVVPGDGTFQRIAASFNSSTRTSVTVAYALTGSGTARALLSADDLFVQIVPEPSMVALLGAGLALVAVMARRRP